jgi:hypothetical protein
MMRGSSVAVLLILSAVTGASAQVTSGTLVGSVSDGSGRPIAQAEVRAADPRHGVFRTAATDASGFYRFAD